jgi:ATP adenylyltransferase
MDHLWSPWRYRYVSQAEPAGGCIFCDKARQGKDEENLVVHRGRTGYVLLNLYPYTTGHVMIAPYQHAATLEELSEETAVDLMLLTRETSRRLRSIYRPHGINIGMNIGECAGAGVAGHIHMHVLPRWPADASFMTTIGETRVIPEDLATTYAKLRQAFGG